MVFSPVYRIFRISFQSSVTYPTPSFWGRLNEETPEYHQLPSKIRFQTPNPLGRLSPRISPTQRRHGKTSPLLGIQPVPFDQLPMSRISRILDTSFPSVLQKLAMIPWIRWSIIYAFPAGQSRSDDDAMQLSLTPAGKPVARKNDGTNW